MNVSKNWIQEYLQFKLPDVQQVTDRIGAQLGGIEGVQDIASIYTGVVVAKVVECSKLENSDHLNLCFIDDDGVAENIERRDDGLVQVVCGAPNIRTGVTVAWLPPGSTVPSTYKNDPFVLEARALRGTVSNGMLASPKELAIGDSHEGIMLLDDSITAGTSFVDAFKLDDYIIDIENKMFTHRPDCFGQLGVAREVAGIFGQQFTSPDWYRSTPELPSGEGLALTVTNEAADDVPRFMAVALQNVQVGPSPVWMQTYLSRVGVRPINNLVDITNYLMLLTGQPLHAYDYDKVAALSDADGAVLTARYSTTDDEMELLSGKTIKLRKQAIMIATDRQAIGLGGVMGGANTEVDDSTTNIILECATFNMYSIRRTSMAHGLFTDAVTRYNKGQSPLQNAVIMAKAIELLQQSAGGSVASETVDLTNDIQPNNVVAVTAAFINARLGLELTVTEMAILLTNVEFTVEVTDDTLSVQAPFWRTDIELAEDVVEEVGRLYGFDKLPLALPARPIVPAAVNSLLSHKAAIRRSLVAAGANEVLTYSFVHGDLLAKASQPLDQAFKLTNALSPDLQYYRYNALPSLLDKVHANIKAGHDSFALFELARGHATDMLQDDGLPAETELLDFVYASKHAGQGAAFYVAREYLQKLAFDLGVAITFSPLTDSNSNLATVSYDSGRSAVVKLEDGTILGYIGEFKASVRKAFKLPTYCAGFTVDRQVLLTAAEPRPYIVMPRFPKIERDICLRTDSSISFAELTEVIGQTISSPDSKSINTLSSLTPLDIYQKDESSKQTTYRVSLAHYEKTMTEAEMTALLDKISENAHRELGAQRV